MHKYTCAMRDGKPVLLRNGWEFQEMDLGGNMSPYKGGCVEHVPYELAFFGYELYFASRHELGKVLIHYTAHPASQLVRTILEARYREKTRRNVGEIIGTGESLCYRIPCSCCFAYYKHNCEILDLSKWHKRFFLAYKESRYARF